MLLLRDLSTEHVDVSPSGSRSELIVSHIELHRKTVVVFVVVYVDCNN